MAYGWSSTTCTYHALAGSPSKRTALEKCAYLGCRVLLPSFAEGSQCGGSPRIRMIG